MNRSVLVVDDHPLVREVVKSMLEARGIEVLVAKNGPDAMASFTEQPTVAVMIDVDMPGPNGVEVCRAIRDFAQRHHHKVAIWLMTGVDRPGLKASAAAAGARGVIPKPFTTQELLLRIQPVFEELPAA